MTFEETLKVEEVDRKGRGLSEWEVDFIAELVDRPPAVLSRKQREKLDDIYTKRVTGSR